jgi:hypothetical protein
MIEMNATICGVKTVVRVVQRFGDVVRCKILEPHPLHPVGAFVTVYVSQLSPC